MPGIGFPCGQVVGSPRARIIAPSTVGEMMCSQRPASSCASAHERPSMSVRKRSAKRWRRTTVSARASPSGRNRIAPLLISTRSAPSMRRIISETAGRETSRRSAMRAWMTSTSSSRSSKIVSQYSSKAGCHSRCLFGAMGKVYGRDCVCVMTSWGPSPGP